MAYVIVGSCVNDAACVDACPVDCIHPAPGEAAFSGTDMLYIDPDLCVDCNACAEACPIGAVMPAIKLPVEWQRYREINAAYAREHRR